MSERGRDAPPRARRCGPGERRVYRNKHLTIQRAAGAEPPTAPYPADEVRIRSRGRRPLAAANWSGGAPAVESDPAGDFAGWGAPGQRRLSPRSDWRRARTEQAAAGTGGWFTRSSGCSAPHRLRVDRAADAVEAQGPITGYCWGGRFEPTSRRRVRGDNESILRKAPGNTGVFWPRLVNATPRYQTPLRRQPREGERVP